MSIKQKLQFILMVGETAICLPTLVDRLSEQFQVDSVHNAKQALERSLLEPKPDLILVDTRLPDSNGRELCRHLAENMQTSDIPVILIANDTHLQGELQGLAAGAVDYIRVPVTPEIVLARIRIHLTTKEKQWQMEEKNNQFQKTIDEINGKLVKEIAERIATETNESEERFKAVAESATDSIISIDFNGIIHFFNRWAEHTFQYSASEIIGKSVSVLIPDIYSNAHHNAIDSIKKTGMMKYKPGTILTMSGKRKDGEEIPLEMTLASWEVSGNLNFSAIIRDVSSKKRLEQRLVQSQKMEAIGTLAGGIAHDFNNILGIITGNAELGKRKLSNLEDVTRNIQAAATRGRDLVRQLLTFSREAEKNKIRLSPVPLIREVLRFMRSTLPATIHIQNEIHDEEAQIYADSIQFYQVIMNLCTNAGQSMGEKGGTLTVGMQRCQILADQAQRLSITPGPYLSITVRDTGPGISAEVQKHMFDPFFTTKEKDKGTGLGLSVVYGAIHDCGGVIHVESELGQGAEFRIYIPEAIEQHKEIFIEDDSINLKKGSGRILFVDDEMSIVEIWGKMLTGLGYTVVGLTNPLTALAKFKDTPNSFDAVITDQTMPKMLGNSLGMEIMKIHPNIPVFLCTGYSESISEEQILESGFRRIFIKPVSLLEISSALSEALSYNKIIPIYPANIDKERYFIDQSLCDAKKPDIDRSDLIKKFNKYHISKTDPYQNKTISDLVSDKIRSLIKILIVDNKPEIVNILENFLSNKLYNVFTAFTGVHALNIINTHPIDLLVTDIGLPDMDGLEVLAQASKILPDLQSIIITGNSEMEYAIAALNLGAFSYLMKPLNLNEFNTHIERCYEKISLKKALDEAHNRAMASSQAKSNFLATMSHEIRTPMNVILGMTDLALQCDMQPKLKDYLTKITHSSRALMRILNDILDFSKIEANKLELEKNKFIIRNIFDRLADLFGAEAEKKGVELIFNFSSECMHILYGDDLRLEQILSNLIANAIKFSKQGEVEVKVKLIERSDTSDYIVLEFSVRDTGIGMTADSISQLFEPFVQADGSITRKFGGSGLGLAISKRLVEMMEGHIWVESIPGNGSHFRFTVKVKQQKDEIIENALLLPNDLHALKSLVIVDRPTARESMQQLMQLFRFETTAVSSEEEAMEAIQAGINNQDPFQLILIDCRLPEMDGFTMLRKMTDLFLTGSPPKIILLTETHNNKLTDRQTQNDHKANAILVKPVNCSVLFNTIMKIFDKTVAKDILFGNDIVDHSGISQRVGGATVLLVEDNILNQQFIKELLESIGVIVELANNGLEAITMLHGKSYDIVLMDIHMPEMDGYSATKYIRELKGFEKLPIIALTADAMTEVREKCIKFGMNDYISKPINKIQLFTILEKWIPPEHQERQPVVSATRKPTTFDTGIFPNALPGIDIASALERINGNFQVLLSVLSGFQKNFSTSAKRIQTYLGGHRQTDAESAKILLHTIKGIAGNVSAHSLFRAAMAFETGVKENQQKEWPRLLKNFENALNEVLQSIESLKNRQILALTDSNTTNEAHREKHPVDLKTAVTQLKKLFPLIDKADFNTMRAFNNIKPMLGTVSLEARMELELLEEFLQSFSYKKARASLDKLLKLFENTNY
ncbi:MAG: response regulator [Magnetococcus sp. DMHC-1]